MLKMLLICLCRTTKYVANVSEAKQIILDNNMKAKKLKDKLYAVALGNEAALVQTQELAHLP